MLNTIAITPISVRITSYIGAGDAVMLMIAETYGATVFAITVAE
jgi:hypothetical protein